VEALIRVGVNKSDRSLSAIERFVVGRRQSKSIFKPTMRQRGAKRLIFEVEKTQKRVWRERAVSRWILPFMEILE
jgi:hypothetical protein